MPSIQQVIAEIQLAPDLPAGHITKAVQIIRDAEQRLKIKGVNSKPRKPSGKNLVSIEVWEENDGWPKAAHSMNDWINRHGLCTKMVNEMIDEFRREMRAKGKQYASFSMAFQTYLRKGYLSRTLVMCKIENSPYKLRTQVDKRGINL